MIAPYIHTVSRHGLHGKPLYIIGVQNSDSSLYTVELDENGVYPD